MFVYVCCLCKFIIVSVYPIIQNVFPKLNIDKQCDKDIIQVQPLAHMTNNCNYSNDIM